MKLITIFGTRPQFIKSCLLSKKIKENKINEIIIHTGQHYDNNMSDIFFKGLNLTKPKYNLNIKENNHGSMTGKMIIEIEKILLIENPIFVIVYGDCNTTMAGAIAATKLNIPVIHIESGLRSFDKKMPEEINRIVTDHMSTYLFCPTKTSIANLASEGLTQNVFLSGDLMIELLRENIKIIKSNSCYLQHNLTPNEYYLATIHRQSNTSTKKLKEIISFFSKQIFPVLFCVHPRTMKVITDNKITIPTNIICSKPVGFLEMMSLLYTSKAVFTDSGGLQKEAYELKIPCFTLRKNTEWKELILSGWNRLGFPENVEESIKEMLNYEHEELYLHNPSKKIMKVLNELKNIKS